MVRAIACVLASVLVVLLTVTPASAHDELGFTGVVHAVAADGKTFTLKYREAGKDETVELTFTAKTTITKDKQRVTKAALAVGTRVRVAAFGCLGEQVDVSTIQILPAAAR